MDEIPEDVKKAATDAVMGPKVVGALFSENYILPVARAILAERERCARVQPESDIEIATTPYEDAYSEGFLDCRARFVAGIRRGEQPNPSGEIVRAIMTERERCARIAEAETKDPDAPLDEWDSGWCAGAAHIADAIRKGA